MTKSMRKISYFENILEFKENSKERLNLNEVNNMELCRTCLIDTNENDMNMEKMSVMDVMQGSFHSIKEMLVEITNIDIIETENLPIKVCKECFSKITALYYFSIQVRKADKVLKLLVNKLKGHEVQSERDCETESDFNETEIPDDSMLIEVEELFDCTDDLKDIEDTKICEEKLEKPERNKKISEKRRTEETSIDSEINEQCEYFEEISVIEAALLADEANQIESKNNFYEEVSQLKKDLLDWEATSDTEKEDTIKTSLPEKVKVKIRKAKKRTSSATGYKHKQPRVTSPLLLDFTCAICQSTFDRQQDLIYHVRESHPNSKAYKCRVCGNLFSHIQSLSRHMNTHKNAVVLHECEVCTKPFIRVDDLKRHRRIHTGERPYACRICDKTYQQQSELKCHLDKHTSEENFQPKIFECAECDRTYQSRNGLYMHKRRHHKNDKDNLNYDCTLCEESFEHRTDLKRHTAKHFLSKTIKRTKLPLRAKKHIK